MSKDEITRRDALTGLGKLAVAGTVGQAGCAVETADDAGGEKLGALSEALIIAEQLLNPFNLQRVHAYTDKSVVAGSSIQLHVSSPVPMQLSLVRLGWDADSSARDWIQSLGTLPAQPQPIRPGSYIQIDNAIAPSANYSEFSLECWVRPRRHKWQGLISQYTYPANCGFGLFLSSEGKPCAYFGTGGTFTASSLVTADSALPLNVWSHVVATFINGVVRIYLNNGLPFEASVGTPVARGANAPLRIGAYGENGLTGYTFDGDIAMPVIYSKALTTGDVNARWNDKASTVPTGSVRGCWKLDEESGTTVDDASPDARDGRIINNGTWMVGGPKFNASPPANFPKASYIPGNDSTRGHGLRLASDDLANCGWSPSGSPIAIPADMPPGVYSARLQYTLPGLGAHTYDTIFVVRRAASKPQARLLVLCNSSTWHAYNVPFPHTPDAPDWGVGGPGASEPGAPAASMYAPHANEAPCYKVSTRLPWSPFPYLMYGAPHSHLLKAERYLHNWLEQNGYDYDVASDYDLHLNASLLTGYKAVIINGHSEYWSAENYNALKQYLAGGGNVFVASGNTMFWRVSYSPGGDVMECRKLESEALFPTLMGGMTNAKVGELYHSHDGARGGLLRESGYPAFGAGLPAWKVIGVDSIGYAGPNPNVGFKVTSTSTGHAFFTWPENVGVAANVAIGVGAVHHEWDVTLAKIPGSGKPSPDPGALPVQLARAEVSSIARYVNYRCDDATQPTTPFVISEMVDWQRPAGGRVFAAGAIAVGSKLESDSQLSALSRNVLHQFGVKQRVDLFAIGSTGRVRMRRWNGDAWAPSGGAWDDTLGGTLQGPLQAVCWSPNHVSILGVNAAGNLLYRYWNGQIWNAGGFSEFAGPITGRPAAVGFGRNRLNIYARGTDGIIRARWWDGAAWGPGSGWSSLGSTTMLSDPAAVGFQGEKVALAAIGTNRRMYIKTWNGAAWSPTSSWSDLGGDFDFAPAWVAWGGSKLNLFGVNHSDGHLLTRHFDGSNWDPVWYDLGGTLASRPIAVARRAKEFSIFAVGTDGKMKVKWFDGTTWFPGSSTWTDLGGSFVGEPAATSWRGNHVSLMGVSASGTISFKWTNGVNWFPSLTTWDDITGELSGTRPSPTLVSFIGS